MSTTLENMKVPNRKPNLDHRTFITVIRAHNDKRHGSETLNYWAGICPACWRKTQG